MNEKVLALKVDVDTLKGYLEGVPKLLDLFGRLGVEASFFFSFGPDNSGKAIRRVFRKGFIGKMFRTNAPGTYGLKTMMYGTILPAPLIVPRNPDIFLRAVSEGHECGIHAWDHVAWQDTLDSMPEEKMRDEFSRAYDMFTSLCGKEPRCCAAPAWKVTAASLEMQDQFGFDFCSDTRGTSPFIPRIGDRVFKTPQVPTTLPTMDELLGSHGIDDGNINHHLLGLMKQDLNVHTVHTEMEGGAKKGVLEDLLARCTDIGISITSLGGALTNMNLEKLPVMDAIDLEIPGRAGKVAAQSE